MNFSLHILGVSGAVPAYGRFPTSQLLKIRGAAYLIDCGEGTQMRLQQFGLGWSGLNHIFISHLHGDHIYGLPGLLTSMALNGRTSPLHIYAPAGLEDLFSGLRLNENGQPYAVHYHVIDTEQAGEIYADQFITVSAFPVFHHVPTCGFVFREPQREPNLRAGVVKAFQIPFAQIPDIKAGRDFTTDEGQVIVNSELTIPPPKPRAYAFCTDTRYLPETAKYVEGVDLLYHEATFTEAFRQQAIETRHSTAAEAAQVAKEAGVGKLVIGHYSARFDKPDALLAEAKAVFPNTFAGMEGEVHEIPFEGRKERGT